MGLGVFVDLPVPDVRRITLRLNLRREDAMDLEQVAGLVAAAEPIGLAETPSAVCRLLAPIMIGLCKQP